jgi:hypothetical protein
MQPINLFDLEPDEHYWAVYVAKIERPASRRPS